MIVCLANEVGKNRELRSLALCTSCQQAALGAEERGPSSQGTELGLQGMVLIPDSTKLWTKCRKGCLSTKGGGRCWELHAFPGYLTGRKRRDGACWSPAFVCCCLPGASMTYFCKHFQRLPPGRTCPEKCGFPPLWLVPYHIIRGCSFSCFYLLLRELVRNSCLEELCWRAESTRKTIKCLPASPS